MLASRQIIRCGLQYYCDSSWDTALYSAWHCCLLLNIRLPAKPKHPQECLIFCCCTADRCRPVGQGHQRNGQERREGNLEVTPVNLCCVRHDECSHKDQGWTGGVGGDRAEDGGKEHGNGEATAQDKRSDSCKHQQRQSAAFMPWGVEACSVVLPPLKVLS